MSKEYDSEAALVELLNSKGKLERRIGLTADGQGQLDLINRILKAAEIPDNTCPVCKGTGLKKGTEDLPLARANLCGRCYGNGQLLANNEASREAGEI